MERGANDRKSVLMIISSMLIFGTVGIFRRYIPLSSAFLAFSRGMLGGVFLLVFLLFRRPKGGERLSARDVLKLAGAGALIGINWILLFEAYGNTTVGVATLCYYMEPTIVTLLSPLIFRERLTLKKALCAAAAIVGMVFVSGVIGGTGEGSLKGVLLGLGAAVFYSAVVILNKKIAGVDPYRKSAVQLLAAGAVMIPYLIFTGGFAVGRPDAKTVVLTLVMGLVHTGIAYVLYFGSMDGLRAQSVAILSYIDPVSALLFSALLLREPLSLLGVVGAVMIIGSAVVSEISVEKNRKKIKKI